MFQGEAIRLSALGDGLLEMTFDRQGSQVNVLDGRALQEWREVNAWLATQTGIRGLLVTSAKDVFIVGADIGEFAAIFSLSDEALVSRTLDANSILNAFEDLPFPTVAAINGYALGGGLEMALSADARVMSESARIGLPEISLGIYPAYGGTVRLARLAPLGQALDWVLNAGMHTAREALDAGVVDAVAAPAQLRDEALHWLRKLASDPPGPPQRRLRKLAPVAASPYEIAQAAAPFRRQAQDAEERRHLPAARIALEMIQAACACPRAQAQALETASFPQVAKSAQAAALIRIFQNEQAVKKLHRPGAALRETPVRAGVTGAGIMGGGIAYACALKGISVRLRDVSQKQLDVGLAEARRQLERQLKGGRMTAERVQAVLGAIHPQLDGAGFESVDLAIEAVVEDPAVKRQVLSELERRLPAHAVLATNTSSLRVSDLAQGLQRPQRFAGLHFFNPVPMMPLVEVIRGEHTDADTLARATAFVLKMGKTPVVVRDCPGFLVNRVVTPYLRAFIRLVSLGADPYAIDRAMVAYGWPMGPAHLEDVVGLDTGARVLDVIAAGYGERMPVLEHDILRRMAEHGVLGQKVGAGFYLHATDAQGKATRVPNPALAPLLASVQPAGARDFTAQEIVDHLMLPMLLESARCLQEQVVSTAAELDLALLLGLGYPRYLGGALQQIDQTGWDEILRRCEPLAHLGPEYQPTPAMRDMARSGRRFFN